jgi:hypothetical protein
VIGGAEEEEKLISGGRRRRAPATDRGGVVGEDEGKGECQR